MENEVRILLFLKDVNSHRRDIDLPTLLSKYGLKGVYGDFMIDSGLLTAKMGGKFKGLKFTPEGEYLQFIKDVGTYKTSKFKGFNREVGKRTRHAVHSFKKLPWYKKLF